MIVYLLQIVSVLAVRSLPDFADTFRTTQLITTTALILQLVVARLVVLDFSFKRIQLGMSTGVLISCLYCFELIYREKMRAPMSE